MSVLSNVHAIKGVFVSKVSVTNATWPPRDVFMTQTTMKKTPGYTVAVSWLGWLWIFGKLLVTTTSSKPWLLVVDLTVGDFWPWGRGQMSWHEVTRPDSNLNLRDVMMTSHAGSLKSSQLDTPQGQKSPTVNNRPPKNPGPFPNWNKKKTLHKLIINQSTSSTAHPTNEIQNKFK